MPLTACTPAMVATAAAILEEAGTVRTEEPMVAIGVTEATGTVAVRIPAIIGMLFQ